MIAITYINNIVEYICTCLNIDIYVDICIYIYIL